MWKNQGPWTEAPKRKDREMKGERWLGFHDGLG